MRDLVAAVAAVFLILVAASLATTLRSYRKRLSAARETERRLGRTIVAELPTSEDLVLLSEDETHFYYRGRSIDKLSIAAVRVLINGSPIAAAVSRRHPGINAQQPTAFDDRPEGIARDRWDVAIETIDGMILVECGAIRERVSQELARAVFDAVRLDIDRNNARP